MSLSLINGGKATEEVKKDNQPHDGSILSCQSGNQSHPLSEVSVGASSSSSPYRRDRFVQRTRREAFSRQVHRPTHIRKESDDEKKWDSHDSRHEERHHSSSEEIVAREVITAVELGPIQPNANAGSSRARRLLRKRYLSQFGTQPVSDSTNRTTCCGETCVAVDQHLVDVDDGEADSAADPETKPQHHTTNSGVGFGRRRYYRVAYRGVVALLAEPNANAERSGAYLGYGEIFVSGFEIPSDESGSTVVQRMSGREAEETSDPHPRPRGTIDSPPRSVVSHHTIGSVSALDTFQTQTRSTISHTSGKEQQIPDVTRSPLSPSLSHGAASLDRQLSVKPTLNQNMAIRVDRVLTGGYAIDGLGGSQRTLRHSSELETGKKRSGVDYPVAVPAPSANTGEEGIDIVHNCTAGVGFLFLRTKHEQIVEPIDELPQFEEGNYQYCVVSSTPLPIYAGPALDAPRIKAMALPGTVHDVSLRLRFNDASDDGCSSQEIWFLRLSHRRGWVLDKKQIRKGQSSEHWIPVMKEILNCDDGGSVSDDVSVVSSVASSSAMTPTAAGARRRHRPPRKHRDGVKDHPEKPSRHIAKTVQAGLITPVKAVSKSIEHNSMTPSSTVSILSDDSSVDRSATARNNSVPTSPDYSLSSTIASNTSSLDSTSQNSQFFLMRVTAPRGLKILDTPQFQVSHLIHGKPSASLSHFVSQPEALSNTYMSKSRNSIFQTMSGRLTHKGGSAKTTEPNMFGTNSNTRVLPCGSLFEASKPMESTGLYSQGAGLIKLSDGSGWAVVPRQDELARQFRSFRGRSADAKDGNMCAYEEVGHATIENLPLLSLDSTAARSLSRTKWLRVACRSGVPVTCPPSATLDDETSSRGSSAISASNLGLSLGQESDVTSSVASTFVEAVMFRTPKKKGGGAETIATNESPSVKSPPSEKLATAPTIPCGMCVEVEKYATLNRPTEFARVTGGQGWVALDLSGKEGCTEVSSPAFRFGSFWFRVQTARGIKVRLGPSKKAPSIKSEDGVYFRFECGEFLRASEVMTIFSGEGRRGKPVECFAKLYRNRHALLHQGHEDYRSLQSLTVQSEWVQVYSDEELNLEECDAEPRIERHKQGWRYSVLSDEGISIRKGPSFSAETTGKKLLKGESVVINERVTPGGEKIAWLRMKEGEGWLHDIDDQENQIMAA